MDTLQIKRVLFKIAKCYKEKYNCKLFYRVCACDRLPRTLPQNEEVIIICNLDPISMPGVFFTIVLPLIYYKLFTIDL